jgi:hypothetical protein
MIIAFPHVINRLRTDIVILFLFEAAPLERLPGALFSRCQGSEVGPQSVDPIFQSTQGRNAAFDGVEKSIGLVDIGRIRRQGLARLVVPRIVRFDHPPPAVQVALKAERSALTNHGDG